MSVLCNTGRHHHFYRRRESTFSHLGYYFIFGSYLDIERGIRDNTTTTNLELIKNE